jgi:hypothetical protein
MRDQSAIKQRAPAHRRVAAVCCRPGPGCARSARATAPRADAADRFPRPGPDCDTDPSARSRSRKACPDGRPQFFRSGGVNRSHGAQRRSRGGTDGPSGIERDTTQGSMPPSRSHSFSLKDIDPSGLSAASDGKIAAESSFLRMLAVFLVSTPQTPSLQIEYASDPGFDYRLRRV